MNAEPAVEEELKPMQQKAFDDRLVKKRGKVSLRIKYNGEWCIYPRQFDSEKEAWKLVSLMNFEAKVSLNFGV